MNKVVKNILIFALVPTALVGAYYGIKYVNKKINTPSRKQFDTIVSNYSKVGADYFENINKDKMDEIFNKFKKNITSKEADKLIEYSSKKQKDLTISEMVETISLIKKIFE